MHSGSVSYHCKQCSVWPALLPASACAWNIIHQDMSLYSVMPLWLTCLAWESHQHAWHWQEQLVTPSQFLAITGIAQLRLKCKHLLPAQIFVFWASAKKIKILFWNKSVLSQNKMRPIKLVTISICICTDSINKWAEQGSSLQPLAFKANAMSFGPQVVRNGTRSCPPF